LSADWLALESGSREYYVSAAKKNSYINRPQCPKNAASIAIMNRQFNAMALSHREVAKLLWDGRNCTQADASQYWVPAPTVDDVPEIGDIYAKATFNRLMDKYPTDVPWPVELRDAFVTKKPVNLATRRMLAEFTYLLRVDKCWLMAWLFQRGRFESEYDAMDFIEAFDTLDKCLKADSTKLKDQAREELKKAALDRLKQKKFNPHDTINDDETDDDEIMYGNEIKDDENDAGFNYRHVAIVRYDPDKEKKFEWESYDLASVCPHLYGEGSSNREKTLFIMTTPGKFTALNK
jgi:hypothetical protein